MGRLTKRELIEHKIGKKIVGCNYKDEDCNDYCCVHVPCKWNDKALKKLKEYEDLEEQGMLLRLPCKVGDTVYSVENNEIKEFIVSDFNVCMKSVYAYQGHIFIGEMGFSVFVTKEAAEAALKEREKMIWK